jgi:hypothetical protein
MTAQTSTRTGGVLASLLVLYTLASLLHFAHNAEYLAEYPNLPTWLTRVGIYVTWIAIASVGLVGYVLHRCGRERFGLALLAVYATLGLDGLLHYTRAPFSAHTTAMNFTILFEVVAATLTLIAVVALAAKEIQTGTRSW